MKLFPRFLLSKRNTVLSLRCVGEKNVIRKFGERERERERKKRKENLKVIRNMRNVNYYNL